MPPRELQCDPEQEFLACYAAVQMCVAYTAVMWLDIITPVYDTMGQRVVWAMIIVSQGAPGMQMRTRKCLSQPYAMNVSLEQHMYS